MDKIHEHSYLAHLLPERGANILDLGCRGFYISNFFGDKHNVVNVDADDIDMNQLQSEFKHYYRIAIAGFNGKVSLVHKAGDPQATRIVEGDGIICRTLEMFSFLQNVDFWDWIKMDIESAEMPVIMSLTKAPARQLSIEFHLHTGAYGENEVKQMVGKLTSLGYKIHSHEKYPAHGCSANYWDSLFIL